MDRTPARSPGRIHSRSRGSMRAYFDTAASFGSRNHAARSGSSWMRVRRSGQPAGRVATWGEMGSR